MTVRDEREAAFWDLWRRWNLEPKNFATALLDRYDAIDQEHKAPRASEAGPKVVITLDDGTVIGPSTPAAAKPATAARTATRRRTTR